MPGLPTTWLYAGAAICIALFATTVVTWHVTKVSGARKEGIAIGTGTASKSALESATKTAAIEREAEEKVPVVAVPAELIALCKRSASCKERHTLK